MSYLAGFDIGGTKLAVTLAQWEGQVLHLKEKVKFPTPQGGWRPSLRQMEEALQELLHSRGLSPKDLIAIGVSCGGPLDSRQGMILSPPNLPGWDQVPITEHLSQSFGVPCYLQNDADACAVAEWTFGAGQGCDNMVFLTFGTGFGAGLILGGRLYSGATNMAGELGHCRCPQVGGNSYAPVGYGKAGSFEGFCSGGGIADLGKTVAMEHLQRGTPAGFCPTWQDLEHLTAQRIAQEAEKGDPVALEVYECCGQRLGAAIALLTDLLNPDRIVIGSIYARSQKLLQDAAFRVWEQEALPLNRQACEVVAAKLGEYLGDVAALSVALLGSGQPPASGITYDF